MFGTLREVSFDFLKLETMYFDSNELFAFSRICHRKCVKSVNQSNFFCFFIFFKNREGIKKKEELIVEGN